MSKKAYLVLANGEIFEGYSIGISGTTIGETVFATGMTGYQETLTDPSYYGQIVAQTFPLVGNYGVNNNDFESDKCYLRGYIVRECCDNPSNFRCENSLDSFLKQQNIVGISGVDTRQLTRTIRETGVMNGAITDDISDINGLLNKIKSYNIVEAVKNVSCKQAKPQKNPNGKHKVVLFDFGYKFNIERELIKRNCDVVVVPSNSTLQDVKQYNPHGIMLSNGPGDPAENIEIIQNLKDIIKSDIPIFGICLGHQLMALANDGTTHKLKYGHRGGNQPVLDVDLDRTFITSQNHGYAVDGNSIKPEIGYVSHYNVNDKTCEGVVYKNSKAFTVQFHPEACCGPQDTSYLFDNFIKMIEGNV